MDTLRSWLWIAFIAFTVGYTTLQFYRLAQWKEANND
jgi:hypothetical protein